MGTDNDDKKKEAMPAPAALAFLIFSMILCFFTILVVIGPECDRASKAADQLENDLKGMQDSLKQMEDSLPKSR